MYGLIGKMTAKPGQRDALVAAILGGSGDMPGCRSYVVAEDAGDPDAIWVTEVWDDEAAHRMAGTVQDLWLQFVRGGDPWERYRGAGGATMLLGPETGIVRNHRAEQLAIWENRYPAHG